MFIYLQISLTLNKISRNTKTYVVKSKFPFCTRFPFSLERSTVRLVESTPRHPICFQAPHVCLCLSACVYLHIQMHVRISMTLTHLRSIVSTCISRKRSVACFVFHLLNVKHSLAPPPSKERPPQKRDYTD